MRLNAEGYLGSAMLYSVNIEDKETERRTKEPSGSIEGGEWSNGPSSCGSGDRRDQKLIEVLPEDADLLTSSR
jgi:hypothetical protein